MHGATVEAAAQKQLATLQRDVTFHYDQFHQDPDYILPRHHNLFLQCTLDQRLRASYDYLRCWLRSIEDARNTMTFQEENLCWTSKQFFNSFQRQQSPSAASSTQDSSYLDNSTTASDTNTLTLSRTTSWETDSLSSENLFSTSTSSSSHNISTNTSSAP